MNKLQEQFFYSRWGRYYLLPLAGIFLAGAGGRGSLGDLFEHTLLPGAAIFAWGLSLGSLIAATAYSNYIINRQGRMIQGFIKNTRLREFLNLYLWENILALGCLALLCAYFLGGLSQRAVIIDASMAWAYLGFFYWLYLIIRLGPQGRTILWENMRRR